MHCQSVEACPRWNCMKDNVCMHRTFQISRPTSAFQHLTTRCWLILLQETKPSTLTIDSACLYIPANCSTVKSVNCNLKQHNTHSPARLKHLSLASPVFHVRQHPCRLWIGRKSAMRKDLKKQPQKSEKHCSYYTNDG